jgi:hypothetical protein
MTTTKRTFKPYGWLVCNWVLVASFQVFVSPVSVQSLLVTYISLSLVWISYLGSQSNSSRINLSSCRTLS